MCLRVLASSNLLAGLNVVSGSEVPSLELASGHRWRVFGNEIYSAGEADALTIQPGVTVEKGRNIVIGNVSNYASLSPYFLRPTHVTVYIIIASVSSASVSSVLTCSFAEQLQHTDCGSPCPERSGQLPYSRRGRSCRISTVRDLH